MCKKGIITTVILTVLIICSFSIAVYAYSSYATASVSPTGSNEIYFHVNNNSDADPHFIKLITHYGESGWMGAILASADLSDDQHLYNSLTSYYTETNPKSGTYTAYVEGRTVYMPPITYVNRVTASDNYWNDSKSTINDTNELSDIKTFLDKLDEDMIEALNLKLTGYRKIETLSGFMTSEHTDLNLVDVRRQIPLEFGNTIPSIYINENNTQVIALTQSLDGKYTKYEFKVNKKADSNYYWKCIGSKTINGEYAAINDEVKEYFTTNSNPPKYKYESKDSKLTIIIER